MSKLEVVTLAKEILIKKNENSAQDIHFMCVAIEKAAHEIGYVDDVLNLKGFEIIPEMLKYKPEKLRKDNAWFNIDEEGMNQRLAILDKLIEEFKKC